MKLPEQINSVEDFCCSLDIDDALYNIKFHNMCSVLALNLTKELKSK